MKKIIKILLPSVIADLLRYLRNMYLLNKSYNIDKNRYRKSAFGIKLNNNQENLEAKITMNYHSIEKGLSNINFREGFGKSAYTELIETMKEFFNAGYDTESIVFQNALSVLDQYVKRHSNTIINTKHIEEIINKYKTKELKSTGGVNSFKKQSVDFYLNSNFETLALNRHSVRDYSNKSVDISLIEKAISIAAKTPSTCNRQPWFNYVIREKKLINDVLNVQGGLGGFGNNIDTLILITSNNHSLQKYSERNQGFIDAGMFSMSLIYALQYLGLATCALNAVFSIKKDKEIRKILDIPFSQNLIMFVSVGNYPENFYAAKSLRYDHKKITKIIN